VPNYIPPQIGGLCGPEIVRSLSTAEAARRLAEYGPNEMRERGTKPPWRIFVNQLTGTLVLILMAAAHFGL
jgi:Ca2+-transporting ATPase